MPGAGPAVLWCDDQRRGHIPLIELRYEMPPHLFAYLDLASGSMIIQAAIAGVVAVPILLRNQIRRLLGRGRSTDEVAADEAAGGAATERRIGTPADGPDTSRP
jgi:hypothetical protein